jgi:5-methylcytosine-specific restriction endonuclease McrA
MRQKHRPVRVDPETYRTLCKTVLERDGWRCQFCGALRNLEVHHVEFRSHSGEDSKDNMITLCTGCHRRIHFDDSYQ